MKSNIIPSMLILFALILMSCEGNSIDPSVLNRIIKVNAEISDSESRLSDNNWTSGDEIGVYMVSSNPDGSNYSVLHKNERYSTSGNGSFVPAIDAIDIKFPEDGDRVSFIAYYPYKKSISNSYEYPIDILDQDNQSEIDLLYSDNATDLSMLSPAVNMKFYHQLTKLKFNISTVSGKPLKNVRASIKGVDTKGKFSLLEKSITSSSKKNVRIKVNDKGDKAEAIVIPTKSLSDITIEIINGNIAYEFDVDELPNIKSFDPGATYNFIVKLDPETSKVSVVVNPSSTIQPWEELPPEYIIVGGGEEVDEEVGDEDDMLGEGSEDNPYSISEARANYGSKKKWIEGYIVGYYSGTTVKSFSTDVWSAFTIRSTSLALAELPDEEDGENTFPVFLRSGEMRDALNLNDNPDMIGMKVLINGDIDKYYGSIGLKETFGYIFVD